MHDALNKSIAPTIWRGKHGLLGIDVQPL